MEIDNFMKISELEIRQKLAFDCVSYLWKGNSLTFGDREVWIVVDKNVEPPFVPETKLAMSDGISPYSIFATVWALVLELSNERKSELSKIISS